jgi:DnaJ-class molecular chaperone
MVNFYTILELENFSSLEDVKKAYHRLAKLYHPDKNTGLNDAEKFREIQSAYDALKTDIKKAAFDSQLNEELNRLEQTQTRANTEQQSNADSKNNKSGSSYAWVTLAFAFFLVMLLIDLFSQNNNTKPPSA